MKKNILIIDDDQEMCDEVSEMLRDEGCDVRIAHDGLEGYGLIFSQHYDIILLDLRLPNFSGFEILQRLKGKKDGMKVIVLTGQQVAAKLINGEPSWDDVEEEQYQTLKTADGILSKPFDMSELLGMLKKYKGLSRNVASGGDAVT